MLFPGFGSGDVDTGFIERNLDALVPDPEPDDALWRGAAAVATAVPEDEEPLADLAGFRMNAAPFASVALGRAGEFRNVALDDEQPMAAVSGFRDDERVVVFYEGQATEFALTSRGSVGGHGVHDGEIVAPMPGRVTAVEVAKGETVAKGPAAADPGSDEDGAWPDRAVRRGGRGTERGSGRAGQRGRGAGQDRG